MFTDGLQIVSDVNKHALQEELRQMRIQVAAMRSGSTSPVLLPGQVSFAT